VKSFVGLYPPISDFSRDVWEALESGEVNLFEAQQLARLTAKKLGGTGLKVRSLRKRLIKAHLLAQGFRRILRQRV
jgi:peptidoglycan hydrolase-like protein with peptidoglycan-binding domain